MSKDLFHNRYRIDTARATRHNYDGGLYFVTICTQNWEHYFGKIENRKMVLNTLGQYTEKCIRKTSEINVDIIVPLYAIMPNHIHLIVIIETPSVSVVFVETPYYDVSTNTNIIKNEMMQDIARKYGRLSHILSRFKTVVTTFANQNNIEFQWQTRFHDRIIRNQKELNKIAYYIENNVMNWNDDELNSSKTKPIR